MLEHDDLQSVGWLIRALGKSANSFGPRSNFLHYGYRFLEDLYEVHAESERLGSPRIDQTVLLQSAEDYLRNVRELRVLTMNWVEYALERNEIVAAGLLRKVTAVAEYNGMNEVTAIFEIEESKISMKKRVDMVRSFDNEVIEPLISKLEELVVKIKSLSYHNNPPHFQT